MVDQDNSGLSQDRFDLLNEINAVEQDVAALFKRTLNLVGAGGTNESTRQAMLARTEFETAFMRLVRGVEQPVSPWVKITPHA